MLQFKQVLIRRGSKGHSKSTLTEKGWSQSCQRSFWWPQWIILLIFYSLEKAPLQYIKWYLLKLIYSEKAQKFCEISSLNLSYVVTVKSTVEILQNFVAFSECTNFRYTNQIQLSKSNLWYIYRSSKQFEINTNSYCYFSPLAVGAASQSCCHMLT